MWIQKIHILLMNFTNYVVFTSKNNKVKTTTHAMTYTLLSIFFMFNKVNKMK